MRYNVIDIFLKMVQIRSESSEEEEFILFLKNIFEKKLNGKCTIDNYGNLIVKIPAKNTNCKEPVLFGVHADTVKPGKDIEPVLKDGIIYSKGETILGADDKAGIAELFEAIREAKQYPPLEIVVSKEEEVGLLGSKNIDRSLLQSKIGFVIDTRNLKDVIIGGPSIIKINVTIIGKAAHSGVEPEKGVSSIKTASHAISILKEGWIDKDTNVNVGIVKGGEVLNSVPKYTNIEIECRSLSHKKCIKQSNLIKEIFLLVAKSSGARAKVKMELYVKAYHISENAKVVNIAKRMISSVGLSPNVRVICGGTGASNYNMQGIETVVIGKGGEASHTIDENISIADMKKAVKMIKNLFIELSD